MNRYHDRLLALREAESDADSTGHERYVCPWGSQWAVLNLYEMCELALHPEYTVFPDHHHIRVH